MQAFLLDTISSKRIKRNFQVLKSNIHSLVFSANTFVPFPPITLHINSSFQYTFASDCKLARYILGKPVSHQSIISPHPYSLISL